jgi:nitrogen fixation NifU-like protein
VLMERVESLPLSEIEAMDGSGIMDALGRDFVRMRPRCATLALSTLKAAVKEYRDEQEQERASSRSEEYGGRDGPGD